MSQATWTFCDRCNQNQSITMYAGRGYVCMPRKDAREVDWVRRSNGLGWQDICPTCQDEE
jgi:hypothetical protein